MRAITGLVVVGALLVAPAVASAQDAPLCPLNFGPVTQAELLDPSGRFAYQTALHPHIDAGQAAARAALGAQYGGLWLDTPRQGWSIAIAPGALDTAAGRAAIIDRLPASSSAVLAPKLTVLPTPYSEAELLAVREQLGPISQSSRIVSGYGISCAGSDAFRVEVGIADAETPELVARVQALFGQFGDKVYIKYGTGWAEPAIGTVPGTVTGPSIELQSGLALPRVGAYIARPRSSRCVRGGTIGVKAGKHADLRSITIAAGKQRRTISAGKRASVRLAGRSTKVTVTVKLRDGRSAVQTFTYRRC